MPLQSLVHVPGLSYVERNPLPVLGLFGINVIGLCSSLNLALDIGVWFLSCMNSFPFENRCMNITLQFQELDDLIGIHTVPPATAILRNKLHPIREQVEAHLKTLEDQNAIVAENEKLISENSALKAAQAPKPDSIFIFEGIEFQKGGITGNLWCVCCPKCHLPTIPDPNGWVECSADCGWHGAPIRISVQFMVEEFHKQKSVAAAS